MPLNQVTKRYFGLKFAKKDSHVEYPVLFLEQYITPLALMIKQWSST
jgi:hypothetical protein